jgi:hypothetical protein
LVRPSWSEFGYWKGIFNIDVPQRFGDGPFFVYSWGDSEIRYTWKTLTIGFGTQSIWLGPAQINPILHSNNAPAYPKLDIGIRKQPVTIPKLNWYIGDIEARAWWGYLSESDYFDSDSSNDHNLITGLALTYSFPSFLKGFSIGLNRIMLSRWDDMDFSSIFTLLLPFAKYANTGYDERDQRMTFVFDYVFPSLGFEMYFEWGKNDFPSNINLVVRDLFDTEAYTFGAVKNIIFNNSYQGKILFEVTHIDSSRLAPQTFYSHHIITQGHTNGGQWLGAGLGTGGNSQFLGFTLFYKKGYASLFVQRQTIDNDYARYSNKDLKSIMSIGVNNYISVINHLNLFSEVVYSDTFNPTYNGERSRNVSISIGIKSVF